MDSLLIFELMTKAQKKINGMALPQSDKDLLLRLIDAMLRQNADDAEEVIGQMEEEEVVDILNLVGAVIDDIKVQAEDEIMEKGDPNQMEMLHQLVEIKEKALAQAVSQTNPKA